MKHVNYNMSREEALYLAYGVDPSRTTFREGRVFAGVYTIGYFIPDKTHLHWYSLYKSPSLYKEY
jgi:hypothetical protein